MRQINRFVAMLLFVFVAVACTKTIDSTSLESSIKTQLATKGIPGATVSCPDDIKAEKGGTFTCKASAQGQTVTLQITQTDDAGHVTFKVAS
ncbi:MAG: DUF4333 domain-containing protein [Actinomycetota bacterium]